MRPPDAVFADPRLADLYDDLDSDRSDLDAYIDLAAELHASRVLDVGCGTGCLAIQLAHLGYEVIGVDPASASLNITRSKPGADRITWLDGDATTLTDINADLAGMTGNVAMVFVDDDDWHRTLDAIRANLTNDGWFVFETRRIEARDWENWEVPETSVALPNGERIAVSRTVNEVAPPLVTFTSTTVRDGQVIPSTSTLRFRSRDEIERDLDQHGFDVLDVREAPDRPGLEMVFVSRRRARAAPTEPRPT